MPCAASTCLHKTHATMKKFLPSVCLGGLRSFAYHKRLGNKSFYVPAREETTRNVWPEQRLINGLRRNLSTAQKKLLFLHFIF